MDVLGYTIIFSLPFILMSLILFMYRPQNHKASIPTNWLIFGMLPGLLLNLHRIHDYVTELLIHSCGAFMWKGPWFANIDMVLISNPLDIHHVLSKNVNNYPRGEKFCKIFEILGDGMFNSEGELWEIHRKVTMGLLKNVKYQSLLETILWSKVESGLLPILDSISRQDMEMDLHDIFDRFTFDTTCKLLFDHDPESLSLDFPYIPFQKAFSDAEEVIMQRHYTPPIIWKLQKILKVGNEKKMGQCWKDMDDFIYKCLAEKQNEFNNMNCDHEDVEHFLLLPSFMREIKDHYGAYGDPTKMLRDTLLSLMAAGKDTIGSALSWFFYILAKNPTVEDKILEEIHTRLQMKLGQRWNASDLGKMVYLHGALSESLRLFPPVPFNHRSPLKPDIIPSGHKIDKNTEVVLCFYSMGRMSSIWGEDCMEFKPERWMSKTGEIKHEPSYKFTTFNAGPRTCLGKDTSFTQLKIVAATIISHYHIKLIEGHPVVPGDSIVLHMKYGLKVKLIKRNNKI